MKTGKVAWFNVLKGIGFIEDESQNLVLVDASVIKAKNKELSKGQSVTFDFEEDPSGKLLATSVKPQKEHSI